MMPGFRRAQLRGSEELFRPTQTEPEAEPAVPGDRGVVELEPSRAQRPTIRVENGQNEARTEGRLVRLTNEEIGTIAEALQRLKYPTQTHAANKPPLTEYERLEHLRRKLLGLL